MRPLVVGTFVTLDGVMQPGGPNEDRDGGFQHGGWLVPYFDEMFGEIMAEWTKRADAFLFGRKTYEMFAESWPNSSDPTEALIDTLRIWQFPVVLGTGKRLFAEGTIPRSFRRVDTQLNTTGAVLHVYERAGGITYGEVEVGQETVIFDSDSSHDTDDGERATQ